MASGKVELKRFAFKEQRLAAAETKKRSSIRASEFLINSFFRQKSWRKTKWEEFQRKWSVNFFPFLARELALPFFREMLHWSGIDWEAAKTIQPCKSAMKSTQGRELGSTPDDQRKLTDWIKTSWRSHMHGTTIYLYLGSNYALLTSGFGQDPLA